MQAAASLEHARNALVVANQRLVWATLERYFSTLPRATRDDAFQAGLLGLLRAADLFDSARGFQFSTYAIRWIRQAVARSLPGCDIIRIPCHVGGEERQQVRAKVRPVRLSSAHAANLPGRAEEADCALLVADVLPLLPPREARVLRERFFHGRTLAAIAEELGVCRECVRRIQNAALARARLLMQPDAQ